MVYRGAGKLHITTQSREKHNAPLYWVCFETPESESDSPRTLLYIDDDDEVYENQEVDVEAIYKRIGRKILEVLAKL